MFNIGDKVRVKNGKFKDYTGVITDIDLEYNTMKKLKNKCGMWRIKSGDFFILALPKRIENESSSFFNELYSKMH